MPRRGSIAALAGLAFLAVGRTPTEVPPVRADGPLVPPAFLPAALRASGPAAHPPPDPTPLATPVPLDSEADALFDPRRILDVEIELDPADWDALRVQARTMAGIFGETECLSGPRVSPFTYFPADIRVDGRRVANVGIRKKGLLGSISSVKPALKVKFDAYVRGQRLAGLSLLTLNNVAQDASHIRQCLALGLFAEAGLPAPRCTFAHVRVNGRDLGVYAHVESIKKPFLARHFESDGGNLYEGALSDFRPDWVGTFERDTNASDPDRSDLDAVVAALEVGDAGLLPALDPILDVPAFLDFWAMEVLTGHWDGYASNRNNFYIYHDPVSGRFAFIPWGIDAAFQDRGRQRPDGGAPPASVAVTARLPYRLYRHPEARQRYVDRLEALLDRVWDEAAILDEIDRMVALVRPELASDRLDDFDRDVADVRTFVVGRRAAIESELAGGPIPWPYPESGRPCRQTIGHFRGTFDARWGAPATTAATARADLAGTTIDLTPVVAVAGTSGTDPWPVHAAVQIAGFADRALPPLWRTGDGLYTVLYVDPARLGANRTIAVDGTGAFGWAILAPLNDDGTRRFVLAGILWGGEVTFDDADTRAGGPVSGTIDVDIVTLGGM